MPTSLARSRPVRPGALRGDRDIAGMSLCPCITIGSSSSTTCPSWRSCRAEVGPDVRNTLASLDAVFTRNIPSRTAFEAGVMICHSPRETPYPEETNRYGNFAQARCRKIGIGSDIGDRLNRQRLVAPWYMSQASVANQMKGSTPLVDKDVDESQWIRRNECGKLISSAMTPSSNTADRPCGIASAQGQQVSGPCCTAGEAPEPATTAWHKPGYETC